MCCEHLLLHPRAIASYTVMAFFEEGEANAAHYTAFPRLENDFFWSALETGGHSGKGPVKPMPCPGRTEDCRAQRVATASTSRLSSPSMRSNSLWRCVHTPPRGVSPAKRYVEAKDELNDAREAVNNPDGTECWDGPGGGFGL